MTFDLRFYLSLVLRRLPLIVAIVLTASTLGILYAVSLPPVYRAEARLLIENPQIPDELAASTVVSTANEILLAIQQRIMTRDNLLSLAKEHDLFAGAPPMSEEEKISQIGGRVAIYMPTNQGNTGVVIVSFAARDAQLSSDITNEIADQVLQWSTELRTQASGNTLEFFEQEVRRLTEELAQQNAKILRFEEQNRNALPESLEYRRSRQASQQERLLLVDRELSNLRDRRDRLTQLYDRTGRLVASDRDRTPEAVRLDEARQELASALVVLSPTNPRVKTLQNEIAALEEVVGAQLDATGAGDLTPFEVQMLDIDGQIADLAEQKEELEKSLRELEESIEATPANSIMLAELQSNYETLRVQYEGAVASLSDARMGDRIEVTDRGQRITMIEKSVPPAFRAEPNRKRIAVASVGAGILLSGALLVLLEVLNKSVRRPSELVKLLGAPPFGTIGYIDGAASARPHWSTARLVTLALYLLNIPILLMVIHLHIAPIGTLIGLAPADTASPEAATTSRTE